MACINNRLSVIYGDVTLGVKGEDFHYIFSYACGGLESMVMNGKEWLYRSPKPTFWRAVTDNDRGNGFPFRSGMWLAADMFLPCRNIAVLIDDKEIPLPKAPNNNCYSNKEQAETVEVIFTYETITNPSVRTEVSYRVSADGRIKVGVHYYGNEQLPQLPVFGIRFIMPTKAVSYQYDGLSGETYPDRMAGGKPGIYEVEGLPVTKYLVPQDCGVHMNTKWLEVRRNTTLNNADIEDETFAICFTAEKDSEGKQQGFAFSCLPYTAEELENATHQEELPPARRTVVSILAAVRGVGGINSWGADVEEPYQIDAGKDIVYSFTVSRVTDGNIYK